MFRRVWTHRRASWASIAVATAGLAAVWTWVDLSPKVEGDFFFAPDDPQLQASAELQRRFPSRSQVVVRAEDTQGDPTLYRSRIGALTEALSDVEGVANVRSITTDDPFRSPLFSRILLTPDSAATNLLLQVDEVDPELLVPRLESVVRTFDTPGFALIMSGVPVIVEQIRRSLFRDLVVFSLASLLLYGLLAALVYRSAMVVVGALTTCIAACSATLLLTRGLGIDIGLLTANLITIVFVLTLSHIVFLTANWRRANALGLPRDEAVGRAVSVTVEASFWSMATTLMGFSSLLVASAQPLRELGIAGAVGAATAMILAYALYPTFLGHQRGPGSEQGEAPGASGDVAGDEAPADFILASFPRTTLAGIAIVVILAGVGLPRLDTDPGLLTYFSEDSALRRGLERIDLDGGSSPLNIAVRDAGGARMDSEEVYERMWAFQAALEADSAVGVVLSPSVLLGHARLQPFARFLSLAVLLDIAESPQLDRVALSFVTPSRDEGLFQLRMRESVSGGTRQEVMDRLKGYARDAGLDPVQVGGLYDLQDQLGRLISSSLRIGLGGLLILFVGVALAVSRSAEITALMVACLAAIPLVALGVFGHLGLSVDIITSPAANVALALGVDSMIHLVVRVRHLQGRGLTRLTSWSLARAQMARPVLTTTLLICVGFGVFGLSSFPPTRRFGLAVILGTLTAATMALVALHPSRRPYGEAAKRPPKLLQFVDREAVVQPVATGSLQVFLATATAGMGGVPRGAIVSATDTVEVPNPSIPLTTAGPVLAGGVVVATERRAVRL